MIAIIDYGLGNVRAFSNIYKRQKRDHILTTTIDDLRQSNKIILPGVGSFDHAIEKLEASGMLPTIKEMVLHQKVPILGICIGMHILGDKSEEGDRKGLGLIPGNVKKIKTSGKDFPLPHMGWNEAVFKVPNSKIFNGLEKKADFYFLHSYEFQPNTEEVVTATSLYSSTITSAIELDNIFGIQFHPEKSHDAGEQILQNFGEL